TRSHSEGTGTSWMATAAANSARAPASSPTCNAGSNRSAGAADLTPAGVDKTHACAAGMSPACVIATTDSLEVGTTLRIATAAAAPASGQYAQGYTAPNAKAPQAMAEMRSA